MRTHPGNRRADRMQARLLAEAYVLFRDLEHPLIAVARFVHLVGLEPPRRLAKILAREQAGRGRAVGDDADVVDFGHRQDLDLGLAFHQVVHRLDDLQPRPVVALLEVDRALRLPCRPVADGGVDHLARAHHVFQRPHRLVDRRHRVEAVQEQHVYTVGLQPFEARLDGLHHMAPRSAARIHVGARRIEAFGGENEIVAVVLRQPAEDLLRLALVVLVGAVEEIDARVAHRLVERRGRHFVGVAAKGHGAETEFGDGDAGTAEELVFHR